MPKQFYIENLGCAKNQVDAEVMIAALKRQGYGYLPDNPEAADIIIINTCGFIKSAQEEAVETLLRVRRDYPHKHIVAAGCLAQRWPAELPRLIPELDGVFSDRHPHLIGQTIAQILRIENAASLPDEDETVPMRSDFYGFNRSVYLKIAEGCNHNCRFCAIPIIKGRLRSRPAGQIVNEAIALLDKGAFELNLVAQDLTSFGQDKGLSSGRGLADLLYHILDRIEDRKHCWIRLLYLHPDSFPRELLDIMASDSRILPYFDIPFQHAAVPVLRKMGRAGSPQAHLDLIAEIRDSISDAVIRSTFLVGHPGEGEKEFDGLLQFQEEAELDWLGVFAWSREEGTASAKDRGTLSSRLHARTAENRRSRIEDRQKTITARCLDRWIGCRLNVLIEEPIQDETMALGRAFFQAPEVDGGIVVHFDSQSRKVFSGDIIKVKITGRTELDLQGIADDE